MLNLKAKHNSCGHQLVNIGFCHTFKLHMVAEIIFKNLNENLHAWNYKF